MRYFFDNDECVEYLKVRFYPDGAPCPECGKATKFHRVTGRAAYSCQYCRHQVYPTAGTIFHKSSTSLQLWFWAIFLMSSTRCGMSAKQLEREIGVSYPTAHRMFKQIRTLLADDDEPLSGEVEMDETSVGPRSVRSADHHRIKAIPTVTERMRAAQAMSAQRKTTVFGMVERGGKVWAEVVPSRRASTLMPMIEKRVLPSAVVFTDELKSYDGLGGKGYQHHRVHHASHVYVDGNAHTNTIEGFWSLVKNGIRGVYHAVSAEYLQDYLNEYAFRYNHRNSSLPMFWLVLDRVKKASA